MLGSDSWNSREAKAYGNFLFTILSAPSQSLAGRVFLWQKHIDISPPLSTEVEVCF
jgi:hypothetical protein